MADEWHKCGCLACEARVHLCPEPAEAFALCVVKMKRKGSSLNIFAAQTNG